MSELASSFLEAAWLGPPRPRRKLGAHLRRTGKDPVSERIPRAPRETPFHKANLTSATQGWTLASGSKNTLIQRWFTSHCKNLHNFKLSNACISLF